MKKLIIANWKMNPASYREAKKLVGAYEAFAEKAHKKVELVVAAPFPWLTDMSHEAEGGLSYAAQDCFWETPTGAYTGEISAAMLKNSGVKYVILGHSERRGYLGETDEMIAKKVKAVLSSGLRPVLCVGETLGVHEKGFSAAKRSVAAQLEKDLALVSGIKRQVSGIVIAYEPVWAISTSGTGLECRAEDAVMMISFIRSFLESHFSTSRIRVVYGGSVNAKNAADYLSRGVIDGVLPGAVSLRIRDFAKVVEAAG